MLLWRGLATPAICDGLVFVHIELNCPQAVPWTFWDAPIYVKD